MTDHFTLTLSGSAQALSTTGKGPAKLIAIQADPANTHVAYVGGDRATVSSSDYGFIIPLPPSSIPAPPLVLTGPSLDVNAIFVLGTSTEKLHVFVVYQ